MRRFAVIVLVSIISETWVLRRLLPEEEVLHIDNDQSGLSWINGDRSSRRLNSQARFDGRRLRRFRMGEVETSL